MIQQAREEDQGKYECVARNEHGVVHSKSAHIYVKGQFGFISIEIRVFPSHKTDI